MTWILILMFGFVVALALITCHRRSWRGRVVAVEALRLVLIAAAAYLMTQPETVYQEPSAETKEIVVLVDRSNSMKSRDVLLLDQSVQSRGAAVERFLSHAGWERLNDRFDRVTLPFSEQKPIQSDLAAAMDAAWAEHPDAAAVVLLSDGDWNTGRSPSQSSAEFGLRSDGSQSVMAVVVGSEKSLPDVAIESASIPTFAIAGKPVRVPIRVSNKMPKARELTVALRVEGREVQRKTVTVASGSALSLPLQWVADSPGDQSVEAILESVAGETIQSNNQVIGNIRVRRERLRVLIVESEPRWEFRYLRNALIRDPGVEVSCLLLHPRLDGYGGGSKDYLKEFPSDPAELSEYDVVFVGDVGLQSVGARPTGLGAEQCQRIAGLVRQQAAGLILMPGRLGNQLSLLDTELGDLFPVDLDPQRPRGVGVEVPAGFSLTAAGRTSLLTDIDSNW